MKFAKILQSELVPEWRKKYIDYKGLKRLLKSVKQVSIQTGESLDTDSPTEVSITIPQPTASAQRQKRCLNIINRVSRSFSNAIHKRSHFIPPSQNECLSLSYDTLWDQISAQEKKFFKALEDNLSKVEKFYEMKLSEATKRFEELNAQYKFMLKEREELSNEFEQVIEHSSSSSRSSSIQQDDQTEEAKYRFNQDMNYRTARRLIKKAVLEFYRGTELLKNYKILNQTGFVKILKKYDKVTKKNGSEIYLPQIYDCNFIKSPVLDKMIKETEAFYVNNFEGGVRRKAMEKLRLPNEELKSYHFVTWRVGLYIGLSIPILVRALELAFNDRSSFDQIRCMIVLQIYSMYFIPIVFALLFGINMFAWSRTRINYKFIFEFDPRSSLNFREYFEIPALMLMVFSYIMYIGFAAEVTLTFVWLLGLVLLSILLCPFKIFYHDAREWFIMTLSRIIASGFFRVEFRDFFIADELNSLTYMFANIQLLFCAVRECGRSLSFLTPLLISLPPWWRFAQCLRQYFDSCHKRCHLVNAGKYFSTIVTVWLLFSFRFSNNNIAKSFWIGGLTISSVYTFLWDVLMDWSLLQLNSQNYLLRDELNFNHSIYYFAIISNGLLRFSWIIQLIVSSEYAGATLFAIAFGEMLRRWQWNFFRVENEHINNCGQFRAIKEIPLPFEKEEAD